MKTRAAKILLFILIVLTAFALGACNDNTGNDGGNNGGGGGYEPARYTVTFDPNGGTSVEPIRNIKYGETISEPAAKPTKVGYTFKYWTESGSSNAKFDFNTPIRDNITLTAYYEAKDYTHKTYKYGMNDDGTIVPADAFSYNVSFTDENGVVITEFKTKYGTKAVDLSFRIPKIDYPENYAGEKDYFVYWYYIVTDKEGKPVLFDDNGNPVSEGGKVKRVQFTTWAEEGNTTGVTAIDDYAIDANFPVYAMWRSQLPNLKVNFWMSEQDKADNKTPYYAYDDENILKMNSTIETTVTKLTEDIKNAKPGYEFVRWYYNVTKGEGEDAVTTSYDFVFDDPESAEDKPTELFKNIDIFAEWKLVLNVASKSDYDKLYNEIRNPNTSEERLNEIQNANIYFTADVDLGSTEYGQLFDEAHPFKGLISSLGSDSVTVKNIVIKDDASASVFGVLNGGTIKNIKLQNVALKLTAGEADTGYAAAFASRLTDGSIENCSASDIVFEVADGKVELFIGGFAAKTRGGKLVDTTAKFSNNAAYAFAAERISIGGITGYSEATGFNGCAAEGFNVSAAAADDVNGANGVARLYMGGLTGYALGCSTQKCQTKNVKLTVTLSSNDAFVGGFAGRLESSSADGCQATAAVITVNGADVVNAGGFVGENGGAVSDCIALDLTLTVNAKLKINAGGLAGGCVNYGGSQGKVMRCYATGSVWVNATDEKTELYAGGLFGNAKNSTLNNCFSIVDVKAYKSGNINKSQVIIGYFCGKASGSSFSNNDNSYYADTAKLMFNDVEYVAPAEGETVEFDCGISVTSKEEAEAADHFKTSNFQERMGFKGGDTSVWNNAVEGSLPTLKALSPAPEPTLEV